MSLLDSLEQDPRARETVRQAAQRRLTYLAGRARWRTEQDDEAEGLRSALPDRTTWATATLWMEAVETALFIDDESTGAAATARTLLPEAIDALDRLGLPLGSALQQAFLPGRLKRFGGREAALPVPTRGSLVWAEFVDGGRLWQAERSDAWTTRAPVGRMRVPVADVLLLARWQANETPTTLQEAETAAAVLQRLLDQQYMALTQARQNTHLWHRLLVPAPLFDLELAVLLAAGLHQREPDESPSRLATQRLLPQVRRFGQAYLEAVRRLRG